ncbi:uncharacterized protein EV420DRAFT_1477018 [Desarmillaria tabescens]|uniref:Uncharacterized protein n=1 Tax=Armillaria tabescens TaxID=1929756 RepID=A0AA39NAW8_ARMTA|nr:uncharacterized protein EV420DRAFT_1477018 [Desarmillaria tabescens]KAK0462265.1 hypothetical protein EV420DRAFT_1477018 [Desarmillaria tabescens]
MAVVRNDGFAAEDNIPIFKFKYTFGGLARTLLVRFTLTFVLEYAATFLCCSVTSSPMLRLGRRTFDFMWCPLRVSIQKSNPAGYTFICAASSEDHMDENSSCQQIGVQSLQSSFEPSRVA